MKERMEDRYRELFRFERMSGFLIERKVALRRGRELGAGNRKAEVTMVLVVEAGARLLDMLATMVLDEVEMVA